MLDQGLIAGSNFVLSAALARWLPAAEYGAFAIAFTVLMLVANVYQALLLIPSLVLGPSVYRERLRAYVATLFRMHALTVVPLAAVCALVAWGLQARSATASEAAFGLALALPPVVLFWFARGALYLNLRSGEAALGAALYATAQLGTLFGLRAVGHASTWTGFVSMAAGAATLTAFLLWRLRPDFRGTTGEVVWRDVLTRSFALGRYEFGVALVMWLPQSLCFSVAAAFRGGEAAGALRALWNLAMPMNHALIALLRLATPHLAARYGSEPQGVPRAPIAGLLGLCAAAAVLYVLPVSLAGERVIGLLYDGNYTSHAPLLPWVLLTGVGWALAEAVNVGLRVNRVPQRIFLGYAAAAALFLAAVWPLASSLGLPGVVVAMLSAAALALGGVAVLFFRVRPAVVD